MEILKDGNIERCGGMFDRYALKGQKNLAQGNALGSR